MRFSFTIWQWRTPATLLMLAFFSLSLLTGCGEKPEPTPPRQSIEVTAIKIAPADTPIVTEFVGETESSRRVEIRARVDGFLERQTYKEGSLVKDGQVLFELEKGPFEANLQQAQGELALQKARLITAEANLKRIRPLAEKDAVSLKDLDDAVGVEKQSRAAVLSAEGSLREAKLNLGYTTIKSPVTGLVSKAEKQEGSYISTGPDSLLTYVAQLDPIWVSFSVSENQLLSGRQQIAAGLIQPPADDNYVIEIVLADGTIFPERGRINFAEPSLDTETGTFQLRAEIANPKGKLRPGQFVRVNLHGAIRPNAVLVPQRAVMQGAKGHFVWVVNSNNTVEVRSVEPASWHGDSWIIEKGLQAGDRVVVDGVIKLRQGISVKITALLDGQQAQSGQTSTAESN